MKRILITGAAGQIGVALRAGLRGSYPLIRLLDIAPLGIAESAEEIVTADIRDVAAMSRMSAVTVSSPVSALPNGAISRRRMSG